MELLTSYWQNQELANLQDVVPVGISRGVPRGELAKRLPYRYKRLVGLAPPSGLFERWKAGTIGPVWAEWYLEKTGQEVPELGFAEAA